MTDKAVPSSAAHFTAPPDPDAEPLRVLLVEDNPVDAHLACSLLESDHAPSILLRRADTVREMLTVLDSGPTDVVLLDLFLPDANGLEAVEQLRALRSDPAIVVLTAHDGLGLRAVRAGAQEYRVK